MGAVDRQDGADGSQPVYPSAAGVMQLSVAIVLRATPSLVGYAQSHCWCFQRLMEGQVSYQYQSPSGALRMTGLSKNWPMRYGF